MNRGYLITGGIVAAAALAWGLTISRTPEGVTVPSSDLPAEPPAEAPAPAQPAPAAPSAPAPTQPAAQQPSAPAPAAAPEQPEVAEDPKPSITPPQLSGPVEELRKQFESEPRASSAPDAESQIEASFRRPELPSGLVKSVLCRSSICKVETRWTEARAMAFMGGFMHLVAEPDPEHAAPFDHNIGIEPVGEERDGSKRIDVYLKRSEP